MKPHPHPLDIGHFLLLVIGTSNALGHDSIRGTLQDYLRLRPDDPRYEVVDFLRDIVLDPSNARLLEKWDLDYLKKTVIETSGEIVAEVTSG